jgi:hypothetical protein
MAKNESAKTPVPPYLSFTTLTNFIDGLKVNMPNRIDKSLMASMSGTAQSSLIAALDYFKLRDGERPNQKLVDLAQADEDQRSVIWNELVRQFYPFLFDADFDITRATQGELNERFRTAGVSGATIDKCVSFFMAAARVGKVPLSTYFKTIKSRAARTRNPGSPRPKRTKDPAPTPPPAPTDSKSYVAATVTFAGGVTAELRVNGNAFALAPPDRSALFEWIDEMTAHGSKSAEPVVAATGPAEGSDTTR